MVESGFYHEFQSETEDSEVEGIIKPQAHWNAKHKPVKLLGYELVEEKVLPAGTTTCTFSGLDGDADEEYRIECRLNLTITSSDANLGIYVNNDTGSNYVGNTHGGYDTTGNFAESAPRFHLGRTHNTQSSFFRCIALLDALTGAQRRLKTEWSVRSNSAHLHAETVSYWTNIIDNIQSLVLYITTGSFSGTIRLWKKLPLNQGD